VPSHLQLEGYDRPQYVNVGYAWDGQEDIEPGQVPERDNPIGCYVRTFALDCPLAEGERLSPSTARRARSRQVNGRYIGYSTDSFTPAEFDLTDALVEGENHRRAGVQLQRRLVARGPGLLPVLGHLPRRHPVPAPRGAPRTSA
jgi:beta-galactosidase